MKDYKNYLKNKALRRKNPNVRKIRGGQAITFWTKDEEQK